MHEYMLSESDRIIKVKIALYNLDLWQIANRPFVVPASGFVEAEDGNPTSWGSLGFVQAWEIRPIKSELFKRVSLRLKSQDTLKRKGRLEDLYTLDYNTELDSQLKELEECESKWGWNLLVRDYLQARQAYRDTIGEGKLGYLKPCPYFPEDKDIIDLLLRVATVSCDSIKASQQKRRRVSYK